MNHPQEPSVASPSRREMSPGAVGTTPSRSMATSTLIRLYLEQGHLDKANQLLNARLDHNPHDAEALAFQARIDKAPIGVLKSRLSGTELNVRWRLWPGSTRQPNLPFWLRIHFFFDDPEGASTKSYLDLACREAQGQRVVPLPSRNYAKYPHGACLACLLAHRDAAFDTAAQETPIPQERNPPTHRLAIGRVHHWEHSK